MKKGVTVSSGTDCPVELPFALGCIQCAVTRSPLSGNRKPYLTDEAFTVKEALDSYTKVAAYASFEENIKGQLKKGYYADFTILDKNIFEVPVDEIKNIKVISTYLEGKKVY